MAKKQQKNNLNLAFVFLVFVFGLILISIFFKIIFVIKESKFDGSHRFNIAFMAKEETDVVSFSPQNKSISILRLKEKVKENDLAKFLEVPINAVVKAKSDKVGKTNISSSLFNLEYSLGSYYDKITFVDIFRLLVFAKSVPSASVTERQLDPNLTNAQKSSIMNLSFLDQQIYQENKSIEIINATNVTGLGNRLADLITNIGGNVVLVESSEKNEKKSQILYYKDKSYTIKYLSNYFNIPAKESDKRGVSDVIIILGEDSLSQIKF